MCPQQKDLIVLNDVHRVFAIDALATSHPLSSNVEDIQKPAQISELFDAISYSKVRRADMSRSWWRLGGVSEEPSVFQGASVLRMLSDFLTEEVFKAGVQVGLLHWSQSGGPSAVLSVAQQDRLRQGDQSHSWTENPVDTRLPVSGDLLQGATGRRTLKLVAINDHGFFVPTDLPTNLPVRDGRLHGPVATSANGTFTGLPAAKVGA